MVVPIYTYSEYSSFKRCPLRHKFEYVERIIPKTIRPALWVGTAVHVGLAAHYQGKDGIDSTIEWVNNEMMRLHEDPDLWLEDDDKIIKNAELSVGMVKGFVEYSKSQELDNDLRIMNTEFEFLVPLRTPAGGKARAMLAGRCDGIAKKYDQYWLLEHKTAAQVGDSYISHLQLDEQISTYIWAIQQMLGITISGCIYNILRKQLPSPRVKAPLFYRELVFRNRSEIEVMGERLYWTYREIHRKNRPIIPNPTLWNCQTCSYKTLCIEDTPEARTNFMSKERKHEELQPLEEAE